MSRGQPFTSRTTDIESAFSTSLRQLLAATSLATSLLLSPVVMAAGSVPACDDPDVKRLVIDLFKEQLLDRVMTDFAHIQGGTVLLGLGIAPKIVDDQYRLDGIRFRGQNRQTGMRNCVGVMNARATFYLEDNMVIGQKRDPITMRKNIAYTVEITTTGDEFYVEIEWE